ncbi:Terminase-like family, partial [uncultured Caudovirales phage]
RTRAIYPRIIEGAEYREASREWIFPSGAKIIFGFCERDADVLQYQGQEFAWIGIDELGHFATSYVYEYLTSRLRSTERGLRCYMRASCNPGPKWIMQRFGITKGGLASRVDLDIEGRRFVRSFVPSFLSDNVHLEGTGYRERLLQLPEAERQMLLEGRWDVFDVPSAVYKDEMRALRDDARLRTVPHDPALKTHAVWDLGFADNMAVICVQKGPDGALRVIDYLQDNRKPLDYYVRALKDRPYNWGTDFIPHDGASKHFLTGKSTQEVMTAMGRTVVVLPRTDVAEGIKLARMVFPRVYLDERRCDVLVDCLQGYKYGVNAATGAYTSPVHDDASHGADAFRYLAMCESQMSNESWGGAIAYPRLSYA